MLVLTRRSGESFFINDDIEIVILETGSHVRIGNKAPTDIKILRKELIPSRERDPAAS